MQCCVPFCDNTAENVKLRKISFHTFPSEEYLRSLWIKALCLQDSRLSDCAVVCSEHFLNEDIYETGSGLSMIHIGAVPSTVQVCMICLDTNKKLFLMSKYDLSKTYENLTGLPLCDMGNIKHTLCVQCAQRLINFKRFRDKSLRARYLMLDLLKQHEFITIPHIKSIDRIKNELNSNIGETILEPDHYDLHIIQNEDKQMDIDNTCLLKKEKNEDSTIISDTEIKVEIVDEDYVEIKLEVEPDVQNYEETTEYNGELSDVNNEILKKRLSNISTFITDNSQCNQMSSDGTIYDARNIASFFPTKLETNNEVNNTDKFCDGFRKPTKSALKKNLSRTKTQKPKSTKNINNQSTSQNELVYFNTLNTKRPRTRFKKPTEEKQFTCDTCQSVFNQKRLLVKHMKTHTIEKTFDCQICQYKCRYNSVLIIHMRTHTGEKPYACELCQYKSTKSSDLVRHMRTHTGEKPYWCKLCDYKCTESSSLVKHMRRHSGEKPFSCELCEYKCARSGDLVSHTRTHTGEKPFSCKYCEYRCAHNSTFVSHMRTHTGEKPFACKLCDYRCGHSGAMLSHMKTHSGKRPYCCKLCEYRSTHKSSLSNHMKTHMKKIKKH